jgi:16S rRNA G527 N7-methylase RsmG
LALLRPELRVSLLEPRARRWTFLREACRELDRRDVEVLRIRHEDYQGPRVENVSVRALAVGWGGLERLLVPGGRALLYQAPRGAPPPGVVALPGAVGVQAWRIGCST